MVNQMSAGPRAIFGALVLLGLSAPGVRAAEDPVFRIEFKDGAMSPREIEVPANTRIKLDLVNTGETPAEFESTELRKEKVIAPKSSGSLIIRTLAPGRYEFFDDFHPGSPPAVLIAK
ncbi:MAG: hypothetical protein JWL62_1844 [Hyphomicrobiales bacterium]|nr:hypothetical protein [Hyphomicrobiales bacterium]